MINIDELLKEIQFYYPIFTARRSTYNPQGGWEGQNECKFFTFSPFALAFVQDLVPADHEKRYRVIGNPDSDNVIPSQAAMALFLKSDRTPYFTSVTTRELFVQTGEQLVKQIENVRQPEIASGMVAWFDQIYRQNDKFQILEAYCPAKRPDMPRSPSAKPSRPAYGQ